MDTTTLPEGLKEYATFVVESEKAHAGWKASLKPVKKWAVVDGWDQEARIAEHYENTVAYSRRVLAAMAHRLAKRDPALTLDYVTRAMEEARK